MCSEITVMQTVLAVRAVHHTVVKNRSEQVVLFPRHARDLVDNHTSHLLPPILAPNSGLAGVQREAFFSGLNPGYSGHNPALSTARFEPEMVKSSA